MSTQTRSGGGGGGRNKSKANKENKENAGSDDQPQQQQQLQQQKANATNNSGGGEKQKKGTDNSGSKGGDSKDKQTTTHTIKTKQPTAEQIRIAQITDIKSGMDDPKIQEKIQKLMETTQRSEEEVCCALQECDNELDRAVIFLLETLPVGAFATTSKKKKNKSQNKEQIDTAAGDGDWDNGGTGGLGSGGGGGLSADSKDRRGNRPGNNQRLGGGPGAGRGGRGGFRDGDRGGDRGDRNGFDRGARGPRGRDGRDGGPGRGSYGGGSRGGRGGGPRVGTRGPGTRDLNRGPRLTDHQEIDAWDPVSTTSATNDLNKPEESSAFADTWGDWDNEEYTGSLSDTKVFTPSTQVTAATSQTPQQQQPSASSAQSQPASQSQPQPPPSQPTATQPATVSSTVTNPTELSAPPGLEQQILNPPQPKETDLVQQYSTTVVSSTATAAAAASNTVQYPDLHSAPTAAQQLRQALEIPPINSASLSAEQTQYFSTLSSQNSNLQSSVVNSYQPSSVQYPTTYGSSGTYSDQVTSSQQAPAARRQRARVPPPSKIPSSAVEMPGDSLNNIGYLDVQFGGLDFGTDDTFDNVSAVTDKFNANSLEQNTPSTVQLPSAVQSSQPEVSDYQSKPSVVSNLQQKSNLTSSLQSTQIIPGQSDSLTATQNDSLANSYSQRNSSTVVPSSVSSGVNVNSINSTTSTLEQLTKTDPYSQSTGTNAGSGGYQNVSYSTSQANKTSSYPSSAAPQGYNNSSYSSTQVSTNTYPPSSNNYSSYNQSGVNSYQQPSSNVSSSVVPNNSTSSVGVSTVNQSNPNLPVNNNVSNNSSNTNSGYLSSQYPVSQTSSAFPSQQSYQNSSQNVYGNTGLNSNTGYSGSTSTSSGQYSNFSSSKLKDTPVSTQFDSVSSSTVSNNSNTNNSVSSSSSSLPNSSVVSTTSMSSPSLGLTNTKVTNSTAKSSSSSGTGVVPNIPMVSPYIQPGVPFYQQPLYSYEDLQMLQQRMSHVPGYYDMNYQTPTSLGAAGVRDANLGSVAYSTMSDGRFTRTDNNSSPVSNVPSTMSQQTGSGGPMLNLPYAYFYGGNVMPGGFQYGTPAVYPPQPMATNATSGGQFQKPAYNSGYGTSGYDALSQTGQDYNKNPYPSSGVGQQSKGQTVSNQQSAGGSGSDIAPSMYGKSHVALNKVNSYEKQSFHSGTPPPYNIAGTQTAGATSGQPYGQHLYIPQIPTHHNINMHQAMHQMDNRSFNSGSGVMRDSNSSGQRPQSNSQGKTATKQGYSPSTYWAGQN